MNTRTVSLTAVVLLAGLILFVRSWDSPTASASEQGGRDEGVLSQWVPAAAWNGSSRASDGANAFDSDRNSYWRSKGLPASITFRLGSVPNEQKTRLLFIWEAANTYSFDPVLISQVGYNNPASATIETHPTDVATPPSSGWTARDSFSGNTRKARAHLLALQDGSDVGMLRFRVIAAMPSPGNNDFAGQVRLYAVPGSDRPIAAALLGDSQVANGLTWAQSDRTQADIDARVYAATGKRMPWMSMGWPGQSAYGFANSGSSTLSNWLDDWPGLYVVVMLGSNDGPDAATYRDSMIAIGKQIRSRGMIPMFCTPPWSSDSGHAHMGQLAAQVPTIVSKVDGAIAGPDIYSLTQKNQSWISPDGLHFKEEGYAAMEAAIADSLARIIG